MKTPRTVPADGIERSCTLEEIAEELGCTPEYVRQVEARALAKLRKNPWARLLFGEMCE